MSIEPDVNVVGGTLLPCSAEPLTGFYRNGCCSTGPEDAGSHTVCIVATERVPRVQPQRRATTSSTPAARVGLRGRRSPATAGASAPHAGSRPRRRGTLPTSSSARPMPARSTSSRSSCSPRAPSRPDPVGRPEPERRNVARTTTRAGGKTTAGRTFRTLHRISSGTYCSTVHPVKYVRAPHRARGESRAIPPLRIVCGTPLEPRADGQRRRRMKVAAGSVSPCAAFPDQQEAAHPACPASGCRRAERAGSHTSRSQGRSDRLRLESLRDAPAGARAADRDRRLGEPVDDRSRALLRGREGGAHEPRRVHRRRLPHELRGRGAARRRPRPGAAGARSPPGRRVAAPDRARRRRLLRSLVAIGLWLAA